jgi:putative oxidoreductase
MFEILRNHESRILAITRILLGAMFTCHGARKLLGAFGGTKDPAWVVWGAGPIELLGGALIAAGCSPISPRFGPAA